MFGIVSVYPAKVLGNVFVEYESSESSIDDTCLFNTVYLSCNSYLDRCVKRDALIFISHNSFVHILEYRTASEARFFIEFNCVSAVFFVIYCGNSADLSLVCLISVEVFILCRKCEVVRTEDHVLRRNCNGTAVNRLQKVVSGKHKESCLCLRFNGKRNVYRHLVTVEVGVKCGAYERVKLDSTAVNEYRLKRLN